jgi:hypothetical protein
LREVRDVFDLSASANLLAAPLPIELSIWSEYEKKLTSLIPLKLSEVIDEFDLSTSDNLSPTSGPILLPILGEIEMK